MRLLRGVSILITLTATHSFSSVSSGMRCCRKPLMSTSPSFRNRVLTQISAGATMEPPPTYDHDQEKEEETLPASRLSAFKQQLKSIFSRGESLEQQEETLSPISEKSQCASYIRVVHTLQEFKDVVATEKERIVVVRWHATYCRSCKAIQPYFYRLAEKYREGNVLFVEVPITDKNSILHQGLGVPSVPFGHIYHPAAGLVEEMKISKKFFPRFEKALQWYIQGSCDVPDGCSDSPFPQEEEEMTKAVS